MKMDTRVFPDLEALSRGVLDELMRIMQDAVARRGRFAIALSGGRTPATLYSLWAQDDKYKAATPWDRVHLFWGDERYVPHDDPLSNYRMTRETLIERVPIPSSNVHPFPTELPQPESVAEAYESELRNSLVLNHLRSICNCSDWAAKGTRLHCFLVHPRWRRSSAGSLLWKCRQNRRGV